MPAVVAAAGVRCFLRLLGEKKKKNGLVVLVEQAMSTSSSSSSSSSQSNPCRRQFLTTTTKTSSGGRRIVGRGSRCFRVGGPVVVRKRPLPTQHGKLFSLHNARAPPYRPMRVWAGTAAPSGHAAGTTLGPRNGRRCRCHHNHCCGEQRRNNNQLHYPNALWGEWNVTATLRRKIYPYGPEYLPSPSLLEGGPRYRLEPVGNSTTYPARYCSAQPENNNKKQNIKNEHANQPIRIPIDSNSNNPTSLKVIQDRALNAKSLSVRGLSTTHARPCQT